MSGTLDVELETAPDFTWREWSLIASACIQASGNDLYSKAEQLLFDHFAARIDSKMNDDPAFAVFLAEAWIRDSRPGS